METVLIGIDPGLTGAVAIVAPYGVTLIDIPTVNKGGAGSVKSEIDAAGLRRMIENALPRGLPIQAMLERVNARPGNSPSSTFSLGDSFGVCRAVISSLGIPLMYVTPAEWKKVYKLDSDKEKSRSLASRLHPNAELHLKKHADRAEALLIADYLKGKLSA